MDLFAYAAAPAVSVLKVHEADAVFAAHTPAFLPPTRHVVVPLPCPREPRVIRMRRRRREQTLCFQGTAGDNGKKIVLR